MANLSTVAIGQQTDGNPLYKSSSKMYVDEINRLYPKKLATSKTGFKPTDNVWVFGSGIFPNAYKGVDGGQEAYEKKVSETFEKYHKPLLAKAIKKNVASFYVGNASGIDSFVGAFLKENDYTAITRYATTGKYLEFVKDVNVVVNNLYNSSQPSATIDNLQLGFVINKELSDKINEMKEDDLLTSAPYELVKADIIARSHTRFPDKSSRKYNFFEVLSKSPGAVVVGNSVYASLVEKILMESRAVYNQMEERKAYNNNILISQKKVSPGTLRQIEVPFSEDAQMNIYSFSKFSMLRGEVTAKDIDLEVGETALISIYNLQFTITNRGLLTVEEAGGKEKMIKSEALPIYPTKENIHPIVSNGKTYYSPFKQINSWLEGTNEETKKIYVYDIAPVKGEEKFGGLTNEDINNLEKDC
jgi:hypothetical protein